VSAVGIERAPTATEVVSAPAVIIAMSVDMVFISDLLVSIDIANG
jgi:hypothetical protein